MILEFPLIAGHVSIFPSPSDVGPRWSNVLRRVRPLFLSPFRPHRILFGRVEAANFAADVWRMRSLFVGADFSGNIPEWMDGRYCRRVSLVFPRRDVRVRLYIRAYGDRWTLKSLFFYRRKIMEILSRVPVAYCSRIERLVRSGGTEQIQWKRRKDVNWTDMMKIKLAMSTP